jgi:hypothetical protein
MMDRPRGNCRECWYVEVLPRRKSLCINKKLEVTILRRGAIFASGSQTPPGEKVATTASRITPVRNLPINRSLTKELLHSNQIPSRRNNRRMLWYSTAD